MVNYHGETKGDVLPPCVIPMYQRMDSHFKRFQDLFFISFPGGALQTKMRSVSKIDLRLSGSRILKCGRIRFCMVSGGAFQTQMRSVAKMD